MTQRRGWPDICAKTRFALLAGVAATKSPARTTILNRAPRDFNADGKASDTFWRNNSHVETC
jgi:hypothetical protein